MPLDAKAAISLIEEHGIYGLSGDDGCPCAHFKVMGVSVDISCSDHCVRVHSADRTPKDLEAVAKVVIAALPDYERSHYKLRFCDYDKTISTANG
jgi:hypothetical protein